jgi:hypothetical protein
MARSIEIVADQLGPRLVPADELGVVMRTIERETIPDRLLRRATLFQAALDELERRRRRPV